MIKFTAIVNAPGCLPEMDPATLDTFEEACDFLMDFADSVAEDIEDYATAEKWAAFNVELAKIKLDPTQHPDWPGDFDRYAPDGNAYCVSTEDYEDKVCALAAHLDEDPDDISEQTWGAFSHGSTEYMVLTDDEADEAWDESLQSYLDECVLPELPETARRYFDEDAWKEDAKMDGRGHSLSGYDGNESEVIIADEVYYIFRTN